MRHGSLFSGIGGFDLAAQWMGWENVFQVEIDKFCTKVLKKNFPKVKRYGDIKEFDGTEWRGRVDIISGGFPCQPFSQAGKRKGQADDRYLWPEMLRIIREIKPSFVVGENVAGLISMENGKTLDRILSDLANEGYTTEQFIIPACATGAWHRRDRIWIVCYSKCNGYENGYKEIGRAKQQSKQRGMYKFKGTSSKFNVSNTQCSDKKQDRSNIGFNDKKSTSLQKKNERREGTTIQYNGLDGLQQSITDTDIQGLQRWKRNRVEYAEQQTTFRKRNPQNNGKYWQSEPSVGRVANGISNRVDRLKGLGNAIVPQVAFEIFKVIESLNKI